MPGLEPPLEPAEIEAAADRIGAAAISTPLLPWRKLGGECRVRLKPECLQPLGSFKIRAAMSAAAARSRESLSAGLATASAGNFGQGLALAAQQLGVPITIHVPEGAARTKVDALESLGARIRRHSFERWWSIMTARDTGEAEGAFIHPVAEREVLAGNATIGLEIMADAPGTGVILVPFGGGGLACGIAMAAKQRHPNVRVVAVESEAATPLAAAFEAGEPVAVTKHASFIDGMGSTRVLDEMWPLLKRWIDDVIVVPVEAVTRAVHDLATRGRLVAEGAGAAALAAARQARFDDREVVAVVSGGNVDANVLAAILASGGRSAAVE